MVALVVLLLGLMAGPGRCSGGMKSAPTQAEITQVLLSAEYSGSLSYISAAELKHVIQQAGR